MLGAERDGNTCKVLLANGNFLLIKCPTDKDANDIKNTLLYYGSNGLEENNAKDFSFEFTLKYYVPRL